MLSIDSQDQVRQRVPTYALQLSGGPERRLPE